MVGECCSVGEATRTRTGGGRWARVRVGGVRSAILLSLSPPCPIHAAGVSGLPPSLALFLLPLPLRKLLGLGFVRPVPTRRTQPAKQVERHLRAGGGRGVSEPQPAKQIERHLRGGREGGVTAAGQQGQVESHLRRKGEGACQGRR